MRVGVHLPQFGRALAPGGVERAARAAEELGFTDLCVSDHLVNPKEQPYPAPYILDPLQTLAAAAAVTDGVGLVTSVLVGPQYTSPLALANTLASLDFLSAGRLTVGIGIGWSRREYEALGADFRDRGPRLDEIIRLFRSVWESDPADPGDFEGSFYPALRDIRVLPQPAHRIPIWIGGASPAALARAVRNDGWHGMDLAAEDARAAVERLRAERPDEGFVVSVRLSWNVKETPPSVVGDTVRAYGDAGVGAVLVAPDRGDIDAWLDNQAALAAALSL